MQVCSRITGNVAKKARGGLDLHNRDSGVARHPLFLAVFKALNGKEEWSTKAGIISNELAIIFPEVLVESLNLLDPFFVDTPTP